MPRTSGGTGGGGGGTPSVAVLKGVGAALNINLNPQVVIPVDATTNTYGTWEVDEGVGPQTVGVGGFPASFYALVVSDIDTTNSEYTLFVAITVFDAAGANVILVQGNGTTSGGGPADTLTLLSTDLSEASLTGVDLSYDDVAGNVVSAAGGIYSSVWTFNGGWA